MVLNARKAEFTVIDLLSKVSDTFINNALTECVKDKSYLVLLEVI